MLEDELQVGSVKKTCGSDWKFAEGGTECPLTPGRLDHISVSNRSFSEINICTNTPKSSLFDAPKTAKIDCHVLELWQVFVAGTRRRGRPYLCKYQVVL